MELANSERQEDCAVCDCRSPVAHSNTDRLAESSSTTASFSRRIYPQWLVNPCYEGFAKATVLHDFSSEYLTKSFLPAASRRAQYFVLNGRTARLPISDWSLHLEARKGHSNEHGSIAQEAPGLCRAPSAKYVLRQAVSAALSDDGR